MPLLFLLTVTKMKRILVTGANGHIGCNVVREALRHGYPVRALVRKTSDLRGLKGLDAELCYGDVLNKDSLIEASRGCNVIIHLAANYSFFARDLNEISAPAIAGTRNMFEAAHRNQVERIVYTSSVASVGWTDSPEKFHTTRDWLPDSTTEVYSLAKRDSERLALELSGTYGIPLVALLPGNVLGRFDYSITPSNRLVSDMLKGKGLTSEFSFAYVDVRDVARIHVMAMENGKPGNRYFIAPPAVPMKRVGEIVRKLTGKRVLHLRTSRRMNMWLGSMMESVARLTNSTPPLTRETARAFSHRYANFDMTDTVNDFQFEPIPLEETVRDTINWFLFLGPGTINKKYAAQFVPDPDWVK
jgi:dihydroflavonol-4-reductase